MAFPDNILSLFGWKSKRGLSIDKMKPGEIVGTGDASAASRYYSNAMGIPFERRRKYDVFDDMDEIDDVASIMDAYSEDSTQESIEYKSSIWIEAEDKKVKEELEELRKRTQWDEVDTATARDVGKYGDDFAILTVEDKDIVGLDWADPRDIERVEHKNGTLLGFEKTSELGKIRSNFSRNTAEKVSLTYKPWDIVHFRLYRRKRRRGEKYRNIYGTSLMEGSERVTKQLRILTDMLVIHRLTQSLDRVKYGIYVGEAPTEEEIMILKRWKNIFKRKAHIDPVNAKFDTQFDPTAWIEDVFWPLKENGESTSDVIPGRPNVGDIVDVDYFDNKFFGSFRAPKAYFGREGEINLKATISSQDMKWGRSCISLQKSVKNGFRRMGQIQLALKGMDPYAKFTIGMVPPSALEELTRLDAMNLRLDAVERLAATGETLGLKQELWRKHIMKAVLGMTDQDIELYAGGVEREPEPDTKEQLGEFMERLRLARSIEFMPEYVRRIELPPVAEITSGDQQPEKVEIHLRSLHPIPDQSPDQSPEGTGGSNDDDED